MPDDSNGEIEVVASPATASDDTTAASSSGTDEPSTAPSSVPEDAQTDDQPKSMADAIAQAFDATTKPEAKAEGDGTVSEDLSGTSDDTADAKVTGEQPGSDAPKTEDTEADPSQEELAAMTPRTRKRFGQLLTQRKDLRDEVAALQPDATNFRALLEYMAKHKLSEPHLIELLQFGGDLVSGEPARLQRVADRIIPILHTAQEANGQIVPQDLLGRVDSGEMTEEVARDTARLRYERNLATQQAAQATAQVQTNVTAQAHASMRQAVVNWHTLVAQSDPDMSLKVDVMQLTAQAIAAKRGPPTTPQQAVEYAKAAYDEATALLRRILPQKAATRPTPNGQASVNRSGVKPAPTSLQDAIGRAFDNATRG